MKKRITALLLTALIFSLTLTVFSSCSDNTPFNGENAELGLTVTGGGFDGKATLISSRVTESINVNEVKKRLTGQEYNDTAELFIYYINVVKSGSSVIPTERVKITVTEPTADYGDYTVLHVTDTKVEKLDFTLNDGKISFEADSLSYFVIAHSHVHVYTEWTATDDGISHTRSCSCGYVATESHEYGEGVKSSPTITTYTCTVCKHVNNHRHEFTKFTNASDGHNHTKTCSCGESVSENHSFNLVKKEADVINYECTQCGHDLSVPSSVKVKIILLPNNSAAQSLKINGTDYTEPMLFEYESSIALEIKAADGYSFAYWSSGGEELSKSTTLEFKIATDGFTMGKSEIEIIAYLTENSDDDITLPPI